jgi:hypothetical protein
MEDLNLYLKDVLTERPHTCVPSADTVLRGIEELATENISYTAEKTGNVYDFNTAEKLNQLLIKLLLAMAANFYRYIVALPLMAVLFGIKDTDRVKSFLFRFIAVPAKWVRTARQYRLNIYSNKPYKLIWEHG